MSHNDSDEAGKIFVGGLSRQTTSEGFKQYFEGFGEVTDCVLMKDKETGVSRGFGFITFANPSSVNEVLKARPHTLDNKGIDPKPCTPKAVLQQKKATANSFTKSHKIFIGGISMEATQEDVKGYFERYGTVAEVVFVLNKEDPSKPHKGFGFVTFEDESSVDQAIAKHYHTIKDKRIEAKKAESRERMDSMKGAGGQYGQNQGYGNNGYGGGNSGYGQGNQGGWMPDQNMMGNYGYGNQQGYPTSYPQQGYGNQPYGYGYGGYNGGNMGMQNQMMGGQGYPQQGGPMGAPPPTPDNMSGNMGANGGYQQQGGMPRQASNNGGNAGPPNPPAASNMGGGYSQNASQYGAVRGGGDYNNAQSNNPPPAGGSSNYSQKPAAGSGNTGYHPYRR
nr:heterogeneous nuclear ribonucleoproteins A2/B1 isoform X1 [Ciona intestinalis]|eukprot:XP_009859402.1 heterogeneous nuclear ribonucleoproteins A2/B1 isoform X1 [Ciona intestinalis]